MRFFSKRKHAQYLIQEHLIDAFQKAIENSLRKKCLNLIKNAFRKRTEVSLSELKEFDK